MQYKQWKADEPRVLVSAAAGPVAEVRRTEMLFKVGYNNVIGRLVEELP